MANTERGSGSSSAVVVPENIVNDQFNFTSKGHDEFCEALKATLEKIRKEANQPIPEDPNLHERS